MAHLKAQETRRNMSHRLQWKLSLVKGLYEQGSSREDILELFRFIDWLLALPDALARRFEAEMIRYEEEKQMPYITSVERIGIEKGLEQGMLTDRREMVLEALDERFGEVPSSISDVINRIEDKDMLRQLHRQAIGSTSLEEFQQSLNGGN